MQIGFTGSQTGMSRSQHLFIQTYIQQTQPTICSAHHGDCVGADAEFHEICENEEIAVTLHPPANDEKRAFCYAGQVRKPLPYLERNKKIVDACTLLIACPSGPEKLRSGTWATIRFARRQNRKLLIVMPNGEPQFENCNAEQLGLAT
ncbi:MAG: hypothetical protein SGI77_11960 [Pirellulaceae bacterium]|nr:hypothetical protein [Pirellulaceae bacterium]